MYIEPVLRRINDRFSRKTDRNDPTDADEQIVKSKIACLFPSS
jgi:hypothetical protein